MLLSIRRPTVTSEIIDGEAVVIDLESGSYFSMQNTAALIWSMLEQGASRSAILDNVASAYSKGMEEIKEDVNQFVDKLLAIALIVETDQDDTLTVAVSATQDSYQKPELTQYDDMQDLLLLDPIHNVDESGWPNAS